MSMDLNVNGYEASRLIPEPGLLGYIMIIRRILREFVACRQTFTRKSAGNEKNTAFAAFGGILMAARSPWSPGRGFGTFLAPVHPRQ
jgi:hypothetical protein